LKVEQEVKR
jgi:hypothetical protein